MPTIHHERGFRFEIKTDDHPPAHVHAVRGDGVVIILLGEVDTPVAVREIKGTVKSKDVVRAVQIVQDRYEEFATAWEKHHGQA